MIISSPKAANIVTLERIRIEMFGQLDGEASRND